MVGDNADVPYDADLAQRVRDLVTALVDDPVEEKPMFGGLSFLVSGHLAVCASSAGGLLVRVPAEDQPGLVAREHVAPMQMGERRSRTWVSVEAAAVGTRAELETWVARGLATVAGLAGPAPSDTP